MPLVRLLGKCWILKFNTSRLRDPAVIQQREKVKQFLKNTPDNIREIWVAIKSVFASGEAEVISHVPKGR